MPQTIAKLLEGNRQWVKEVIADDPEFFAKLANIQTPEFLWIGCSDSRVPANEITKTMPGHIFVHRNIANMVVHTDVNMLSVLHYAIEVLKVKHVIVCGHYNCGGINAALSNKSFGFIDNWLRNIKDVYRLHFKELDSLEDGARNKRLVELNVAEQVYNLSRTSVIQEAWKTGEYPQLHGWVYDVSDGIIKNLNISRKDSNDIENRIYQLEI